MSLGTYTNLKASSGRASTPVTARMQFYAMHYFNECGYVLGYTTQEVACTVQHSRNNLEFQLFRYWATNAEVRDHNIAHLIVLQNIMINERPIDLGNS